MLTDLYVYDKHFKQIHRVGQDCHDSLWVTDNEIYYHNCQNGDGGTVEDVEGFGYVILRSEYGSLTGEFGIIDERFEKEIAEYLKETERTQSTRVIQNGNYNFNITNTGTLNL